MLLDSQGKYLKSLLTELRPYIKQEESGSHLALFNVCRDLKIERKFVLEGIRGFFYEQDTLDVFLKGVRAVINGELWLSRDVMTQYIFESKVRGGASILLPGTYSCV